MAIADDFSVAANGDVRWIGTTPTYTVLEFHRFLQDLADDAVAVGDDLLDITDLDPSAKSTDNIISMINGYNIDDTAAEHLFDGSISQLGGNTVYAGLVVVGSTPATTQLQIVQDNLVVPSYWGTGLNADPAANILLRIMVKTRDAGADIDGQRLRIQARELGDTFAEFSLTAGLGNNTAAIFTAADLNNQTAIGTIAALPITNTEGLAQLDINGNGTPEDYFTEWALNGASQNDLYEFTKWIQRRGTGETIFGMSGELFRGITHEIDYDNEAAGPFQQNEIVTFGNGATGAVLALDDQGATGKLYIQLLTGTAPGDNDTATGGTSGTTADVNGAPTPRTISPAFIGASTGSSIIGAYGIGVNPTDLSASDQLFDLTNTLQVPPNQVLFSVNGLVVGEDRVLVGPETAGGLNDAQDTISGALSAGATTVVVASAIPSDTPASGTIRVFNGSTYDRIEYSSYTGSTYTVDATAHPTGIDNNIADLAPMFISYIDTIAGAVTETFTSVFLAPRPLFIRVRDGGLSPIKSFETVGNLANAGGSTTVIRTSDS